MSNTPPSTLLARRIRSARIYAGLSRRQLGAAIGLVPETIGRYERAESGLSDRTLSAIATATGTPVWFFHNGFELPGEEPALVERVEALESQMEAFRRFLR